MKREREFKGVVPSWLTTRSSSSLDKTGTMKGNKHGAVIISNLTSVCEGNLRKFFSSPELDKLYYSLWGICGKFNNSTKKRVYSNVRRERFDVAIVNCSTAVLDNTVDARGVYQFAKTLVTKCGLKKVVIMSAITWDGIQNKKALQRAVVHNEQLSNLTKNDSNITLYDVKCPKKYLSGTPLYQRLLIGNSKMFAWYKRQLVDCLLQAVETGPRAIPYDPDKNAVSSASSVGKPATAKYQEMTPIVDPVDPVNLDFSKNQIPSAGTSAMTGNGKVCQVVPSPVAIGSASEKKHPTSSSSHSLDLDRDLDFHKDRAPSTATSVMAVNDKACPVFPSIVATGSTPEEQQPCRDSSHSFNLDPCLDRVNDYYYW